MGFQTQSGSGLLARAVRSTETICSLQAIASHDWCDQAAAALSVAFPEDWVAISVLEADRAGDVRSVEAIGVAGPEAGDERRAAIRRRFETVRRLGWALPADAGTHAARMADLPGGVAWAASDAGRQWERAGGGQMLVGQRSLHPGRPDRKIVVEIGRVPAGAPYSADDCALLDAVLASLARRAFVAFGPEPIGASRMLTGREQEVLSMLVLGLSVREIAERIKRSPHTVHDYVKSLHRKLDATSRGALVAKALGHEGEAGTGEDAIRRPRRGDIRNSPAPRSSVGAAQTFVRKA